MSSPCLSTHGGEHGGALEPRFLAGRPEALPRKPLATVLIPARDEEGDIATCLRAVVAQDQPAYQMEVVLVDGGSTDRTVDVARQVLSESRLSWRIVHNPVGTTPSNLNRGLEAAAGDVICRVDARSIVPSCYVRRCVELLESRPDVVVVGGNQRALDDGTQRSQGIARALNNRTLMGGAAYRGSTSGVVDTVYLGAFRTEQLRSVGGWDERLHTNQDFDLNRRMAALGKIWFQADLEVGYVPRRTIRGLWQQYVRFGRWKVRYWRYRRQGPERRQLVRLAVSGLALAVVPPLLVLNRARAGRLLLGVAAAALTLENSTTTGPKTSMGGRIWAVGAWSAIGLGWIIGVLAELPRAHSP